MPLIVQGSEFIKIPVGTTAQRPQNPAIGMIRVNTTTNVLEIYTGNGWTVWTAL